MRFADPQTLQWQVAGTGSSTLYDVVRGTLPGLPVGSGAGESCLASGYDPPPVFGTTLAELDVSADPMSGEGFWFLVRGSNGCGVGTYGSESGGAERTTESCP